MSRQYDSWTDNDDPRQRELPAVTRTNLSQENISSFPPAHPQPEPRLQYGHSFTHSAAAAGMGPTGSFGSPLEYQPRYGSAGFQQPRSRNVYGSHGNVPDQYVGDYESSQPSYTNPPISQDFIEQRQLPPAASTSYPTQPPVLPEVARALGQHHYSTSEPVSLDSIPGVQNAATPLGPETQSRRGTIPNLLGKDKAQAVENMEFRLALRQQPRAARACGLGERDRRNIDPPPIVQLHLHAPELSKEDISKYLRYEGYVVNCSIYDSTGTHDATHMPPDSRWQRRLTGSHVSTPFYGRDEHRKDGCFFPFPDLSVRTFGQYRLKFTLMMLDTTNPRGPRHFPGLAEVFSDVFESFTAAKFTGIQASSDLVRTLRAQGCLISIKRGNDRRRGDGDDLDDQDD